MQRGVGEYPYLAAEAEVLLVVGRELEVVALVAVDRHRVDYVEAVEGYGILADGACEWILQQAYLVVVQVDVGEHVLYHRVEYVARLYEVVHAGCVLPEYHRPLLFRVFPVEVLRHRLVDR